MSTGSGAEVPPIPILNVGLELRSLDVSQIKSYEHNPRRAENTEYDRIKASIRREGLGQPLVVTQRPGDADYVVHAGGNTRLRILKELFAETDDRRFGTVACVCRAWTGEADVLLAHLKENDLRGELSFVDKARAVAESKRLLEEETGTGELSQTGLSELLAARGYGVSQGLISQMTYAVDRLLPLLPQALASGIGRPQVARIRALDRTARTLWLERAIDTEAEYDIAFEALCRRYDTPDWDIASLRRAIEAEIAERAEISIHAVNMELDMRLAGRSISVPESSWNSAHNDTYREGLEPEATETRAPGIALERSIEGAEQDSDASRPEPDWCSGMRAAEATSERIDDDEISTTSRTPLGTSPRADMKSLRARLWTLASRLAQRNGLGDLIEPLAGKGLGFVLRDVPDPALADQLDEAALAQVSMVWWHLAACAELTVAPLEALLPALPTESVLKRALTEQDAGLLFASIWTLDPGQAGHRLWRRLDERDWQDLLGLMEAYRALRRVAEVDGQTLWGSPR
jgi:ParB family protein of integrating conjugative element (PFGI_1 class)